MKKNTLILLLVVLALILVADSDVFAQCAMCKKNVESNLESGGNIGKGINKGILYLLGIPYILIASIGFIFFRKQIGEKLAAFRRK